MRCECEQGPDAAVREPGGHAHRAAVIQIHHEGIAGDGDAVGMGLTQVSRRSSHTMLPGNDRRVPIGAGSQDRLINSVSSNRMMRSRSRGAEHHVPWLPAKLVVDHHSSHEPRRDTGGVVHAMLRCLEASSVPIAKNHVLGAHVDARYRPRRSLVRSWILVCSMTRPQTTNSGWMLESGSGRTPVHPASST